MSFLVAIQRKNHSDCCKDGKSLSGNIYRSLYSALELASLSALKRM